MKSLRSTGEVGRRARRHHEIEVALKRRRIRQHRQAGGAAGFVGLGERGRIEIGADQPLRWRGLLHFGDQRIFAERELVADRLTKPRGAGAAFACASTLASGCARLAAAISSRL